MGRGSRHSKNAGTMGTEIMSYAEMRTLGYGRNYERLPKDSFGNFDDCQLTLRRATNPVCTPWGIIYNREAILKYLLWQTKKNQTKIDFYKNKSRCVLANHYSDETRNHITSKTRLACKNKIDQACVIQSKSEIPTIYPHETDTSQVLVCGGINIETNRMRTKEVKIFWGSNQFKRKIRHSQFSESFSNFINKCPVTGKTLNYDDLVDLKFTKYSNDNNELPAKYVDPITREFFTNSSHLICLRITGDVFLFDIFKKFVEPTGIFKGHKFDNSDLIVIKKGYTGYTAHDGLSIKSSRNTTLGIGSGMTDLRGQHSGSGSKSGLVLL